MSPPRSPEALYHAIPQALAPENEIEIPSDILELAADEGTFAGDHLALTDPPAVVVDAQVRWIHFILGCCVLLPWNVMITAMPYFLSRLTGSPVKDVFGSYLSVTVTASNFVFLAHATAISKQTIPSRLIRRCILLLSVCCLLLTISTYIRLPAGVFVAFTLIVGGITSALGSYMQTSVVAVASLYGPQALQAMMSGQAAVAVAVSSVQVVSSALFVWRATPASLAANAIDGQAETNSARVFFALSTLFLTISAFAHHTLVSKASYKTLVAPLEQKSAHVPGTIEAEALLTSLGREKNSEKNRILRVAKANVIFEVAVAYVFIVTLAVFPPISTSVQPTNPATHPLLFNAIHFLVFNTGDFLGRYLCAFPSLIIWSAKWLTTLSLSRTLFIPIFLMCNIQRPSSGLPTIPPIINSDVLFMLILLLFGLSNGYVSSLCMMSAPSIEHNPRLKGRKEDVDVAATVANFSLVGGLALGSIASFAVRGAICGCNPFSP